MTTTREDFDATKTLHYKQANNQHHMVIEVWKSPALSLAELIVRCSNIGCNIKTVLRYSERAKASGIVGDDWAPRTMMAALKHSKECPYRVPAGSG